MNLFQRYCLAVICFLLTGLLGIQAQHTFSIVAVDTATREVGSAGASCIEDADVISSVHPDTGAIHTQALHNELNQQNADSLMEERVPPQQIIQWLINNDEQVFGGTDSSWRQYGVVDFSPADTPRTAAFTGSSNGDTALHLTGYNFSVQGNILIDSAVILDMRQQFKNTSGSLADKLMAALQGAKRPGADRRCLNDSISALSSFIRVAQPTDSPDSLTLDIRVDTTTQGRDPIDSLQLLYDMWKGQCGPQQADFRQSDDTITVYRSVEFTSQSQYVKHYRWFRNGSELDYLKDTSSQITLTFNTTGTFTIKLIGRLQNCRDTATSTVVVESLDDGIPNQSASRVKISPNPVPVNRSLTVQSNRPISTTNQFVLYNPYGQVVERWSLTQPKEVLSLEFSDLSPGLYFYRVRGTKNILERGKLMILPSAR